MNTNKSELVTSIRTAYLYAYFMQIIFNSCLNPANGYSGVTSKDLNIKLKFLIVQHFYYLQYIHPTQTLHNHNMSNQLRHP